MEKFADCFQVHRKSQLPVAERYLFGLVQAERRNMECMADAVPETDDQQVQHFMTSSPWSHRQVADRVASKTNDLIGGHPDSCLIIDDTGFAKKGSRSVGVARQYCGRLGKVDNCQVAVCAVLCRGQCHSLIDARLYLPKDWTSDRRRCQAAGIPDDQQQAKTKAEIALDSVRHAREIGVGFAWVGMDAGYGKTPWLLRALDQDGETFVADVQKNQRIYLEDPRPQPVQRKTKDGKLVTRMQTKAEAIRVDSRAKAQPEQAWKTITLRDANRGPLRVKSLHQKVWLWNGKEPKAQHWHLIVRQELNDRETIKYTLSNAPDDTAHERLAAMQASRFFVERSLQDAKSTCGMDQYQLRKWQGFHHHMAMIMIAMLFLLGERIHQQDARPLLSCADVFNLLKFHLPGKAISEQDIWRQIARSHRQRQAAIDAAHRKQAQIVQLE